ncbi:MAG: hypothetical protein II949_04335 [Prevotella sp.]|nr:hypothetical protein [Prevotella sp.]
MKRTILVLVAQVIVMTATWAQGNYNFLTLRQTDNTLQSIPTEGLVITFGSGQLTATSGNTKATVALSSLDTMYFSENDANGIADQEAPQVAFRVNERLLQVSAPAGAKVLIVNAGGMLIDHYTAGNDSHGTALRPGIYIVRVNDRSSKIYIK